MKNFSVIIKKWRRFSMPLVVIALVVIFFFGFSIPRFQNVQELREKIKSQNSLLEKLSTKAAFLEGIDEASLKERVDISIDAISETKDIMKLVAYFKNAAQDKQVFIESMDISPGMIATEAASSRTVDLEVLVFDIQILGEWKRILEFSDAIEEMVPLANIRTTRINNSGETSSARMSVETYTSPLPRVVGGVEEDVPKVSDEEEGVLVQLEKFKKYESFMIEELPSSAPATPRVNPFVL